MVRNEDERAQALRDMGAEVVIGDLLDLDSMHRVIAGCETMYFGMTVSDTYLTATVNTAAVAKHHGVKRFINMSQMTVSQMSISATTPSPQHKLHWLAEQALNWSGLPVVHVRPTVFLEGFFLTLTPDSVRESDQIKLPFGEGKTSPVAAEDVARAIAALFANPQPHVGKIYHLTGPQSENMHFFARDTPVLGDPAPSSASQGESPHIDQRENRQHSRLYPIRARVCTKALIREIKRTQAAPLTRMTSARVLNRCSRVIVTMAVPRITTPAETIISVEKRASSVCMSRAPPIARAPKHPNNSPYPIASHPRFWQQRAVTQTANWKRTERCQFALRP